MKIRILLLTAISCLLALQANALDYPHNNANNIACDSCHYVYGYEPTLLPLWTSHTPMDIDDTQYNTLCLSCHNGSDAPYMQTHSSLVIDDGYGDWAVECRTCHNPHKQQFRVYGSAAYLETGTVSAVDSTTLTKSGAADWEDNEYQGLIVVPNTAMDKYNYKILSNTSDTLTVKGSIDLSRVSINDTFGISYGKLVYDTVRLSRITAPDPPRSDDKEVRFYGPTGANSFADGDSTYNGICEVCHMSTNHYRNDGTAPDQLHTNVGVTAGTNCTACHAHTNGFAHGAGSTGDGCVECHGHDAGTLYDPDMSEPYTAGTQASQGRGTVKGHSTHTETDSDDLRGPGIYCNTCHEITDMPYFNSGTDSNLDGKIDLSETDVCDTCHSDGGTYDGVNDPYVGAKYGNVGEFKYNWRYGVYDEDNGSLKPGKEKWCAGCHDEVPSQIQGVDAPDVIGDEDEEYTYGTGWGFYKTGHGVPAGEPLPYKGGLIEPNLVGGASRPIECGDCHDVTTAHIDGLPRTFDDGGSSTTDPMYYRQGYRLKMVNGAEPMHIPWPAGGGSPANDSNRYRLCAQCHLTGTNFTDVDDLINTNLITGPVGTEVGYKNRHAYHLNQNQLRYSADWDPSGTTSRINCVVCHNVHGSKRLNMIRDGSLTNRDPGLQIWYYNDDSLVYNTTNPDPPYPENTPFAASDGTVWISMSSSNLCSHCHANYNTAAEDRIPYQTLDQAPTLDWTGEAYYSIDGVNPDIGPAESSFEFRIKYTDTNNDLPSTIEVWVDENDDSSYTALEKCAMTEVDPSDIDTTNGKIYSVTIPISKYGDNTFTYRFYAWDGGLSVEFPTSPDPDGIVTVTNTAPTLSWTEEGNYDTDGVSPDTGGLGESYEFRITYTDPENECPFSGSSDIEVWIDEDDDGYESGEQHTMTEVSAGDTDCTDGKIYTFSKTISAAGSHNYRFYATDGFDLATGDAGPIGNSTVTVTATSNNTPWLDWTEDTCRTDGVKPARGPNGGDYEFMVTYTDPDNECPASGSSDIQVLIDEGSGYVAYNMDEDSAADTDCTDGKVYKLTRQLNSAGAFNYYFSATDGTDTALGEATGSKVVTVVSALKVRTAGGTGWYSTIQSAINENITNSTVMVYEGTYNESITIDDVPDTDEGISLEAVCGAGVTTISASSGDTVFIQNIGTSATIDGFTIEGGADGIEPSATTLILKNNIIENNSRGINAFNGGALTIENTVIRNNTGSAAGAGININGGTHNITDSTIVDNTATSVAGGGIYMQSGASVTLADTTVSGNSATNGGGIFVNNSSIDMDRVTVTSNTATGTGGGMYLQGSGTSTITNCNIVDNTADTNGGGFSITNHTTDIVNSTVSNNDLSDLVSGVGGGMYVNGATVSVTNSIFWANEAAGQGSGVEVYKNNGSVTFTNSTVPNHLNALEETGSGSISVDTTNIELDPLFVDSSSGDFHLKNISPAIDQGTGSGAPSVDIDGDTRPFDYAGVGDGVDDYDMGSDEVSVQAVYDTLSTSNPTAVQSANVNADQSGIVMYRLQADCDNVEDGDCILSAVAVEDIGTGTAGDWDSLGIYIDTDTDITGATLIGQKASWDGSAVVVYLDQGTQADRTVTNGTSKYIFIVYDITEAPEGEILKSRVTQVSLLSPDLGVTGLSYDSNNVIVNGDTLSTSNNTAIQSADPNAGEQDVVMQRFQGDCDTAGNNNCILFNITVNDVGTAATGDWDSLDIFIDTDTGFAGSTLIGQASFDGTKTIVTLNQGTEADRTITNGTSKYIFVVYDINAGAAGKTFQSRVTGVGVEPPDSGDTGFIYTSNILTAQAPVGGDNLLTSNPAPIRSGYADQDEDSVVMESFQVDCDNFDSGTCVLSSLTVEDLGTASSGDWDYVNVYIDTDTGFPGAVKIGEQASFDGSSTVVSLNLGTAGDRTVTNGTPKYVFVEYNLSSSVAVDDTIQSRVTAVGVASPDSGVTGLTYDSNAVTVKNAILVYASCVEPTCSSGSTGPCCKTIQGAINRTDSATRPIIAYAETFNESVALYNRDTRKVVSVLGPEFTVLSSSGSTALTVQDSSYFVIDGFSITGATGYGININRVDGTSPTIRNCRIYGNGTGIYVGDGDDVPVEIDTVEIYSNTTRGIYLVNADDDANIVNSEIHSHNVPGNNGVAIYMGNGNAATISNSVIRDNTNTTGGPIYVNAAGAYLTINDSVIYGNQGAMGGVINMSTGAYVEINRSVIRDNTATSQGGVIYTNASNFEINNSIITGNQAPNGGVFGFNSSPTAALINDTFADNQATAGGGGIAYICSGTFTMRNSIAWNNSASTGQGHNVLRTCTGPSGANVGIITYSDFDTTFGTYMYQALFTDDRGGSTNIVVNPNYDSSYHLTGSSTGVIDQALGSDGPSDDIDGDTRIPVSGMIDMGADEYIP